TPVLLTFSYNPKDFALFQAWFTRRGIKPKRRFHAFAWVIIVTIAFIAFYVEKNAPPPPAPTAAERTAGPLDILVAILPCMGLAIFFLVLLVWTIRFNRRRGIEKLKGDYFVEISTTGVNWKSPSSQSVYDWNHFEGFVESHKTFLLLGKSGNLILPK